MTGLSKSGVLVGILRMEYDHPQFLLDSKKKNVISQPLMVGAPTDDVEIYIYI